MRKGHLVFLPIILLMATAHADSSEYRLILKNHRFEPASLAVPAGEKFKLIIENQDPTPEEFESHTLNREKIVPGHGQIILYLGPLNTGSYPFFGEFNPTTATGNIVAR